jgi:arylsulfatase A-like enzyme
MGLRTMLAAGIAVATAGALAIVVARRTPAGAAPPNVVLITVESLRPDHMASYGGPRVTSPHIDALAREGMLYENARAPTSWTLPSHASLFTGLYPTVHQTTAPLGKLGDSYTTLAEVLAAHGYQTAGVVSGPYLRREHGLAQGFQFWDDSIAALTDFEAHNEVTSPRMEASLAAWLREKRDPKRPFFLFAYFWDPHYDYIPPPPYSEMFVDAGMRPVDVTNYELSPAVHAGIPKEELAWVEAQYDGEIRWTDDHLGRFFDLLRAQGLWDHTLVIVAADHGEEFFEHGRKGHMNALYVESVHVPLIVKYPHGGPVGRDPRLASLVDVFPTVLQVTGTPADLPLQGRSLLRAPEPDRPVFTELRATRYFGPSYEYSTVKHWEAIREGDWKLITVAEEKRTELYDVAKDPAETNNVASEEPERTGEMRAALTQWQEKARRLAANFRPGGRATVEAAARDRLRALGYLR